MDSNAVDALVETLKRLTPHSVPPPNPCDNPAALPQFFKLFEKYCRNLYGEDTDDWEQVLPSYLRGELWQVAQVLGASVGYDEVKQKLLSEFVVETGVTGKLFTDLLGVTLKENESLKCFLIRLQSMAIKIPADDAGKDALILTALWRNLDTQILYQIDLQLGTQ